MISSRHLVPLQGYGLPCWFSERSRYQYLYPESCLKTNREVNHLICETRCKAIERPAKPTQCQPHCNPPSIVDP